MKNKKIALCISGYLRTFEECYPSSLKNIIQDYNCDIFIHTYDKVRAMPCYHNFDKYDRELKYKLNINFLEQIPNLKVLSIESWNDIKYKFYEFQKKLNIDYTPSVYAYLYKIFMCNELKKKYELENNFKYDFVIRTRGDQIFTKKIIYDINKNEILINSYAVGDEDQIHHCSPENEFYKQLLNDRFAVGDSESIDYLCDLYNNISKYLINSQIGSPIENILNIYLNDNENIKLIKRNLKFYVKHSPISKNCRICGESIINN